MNLQRRVLCIFPDGICAVLRCAVAVWPACPTQPPILKTLSSEEHSPFQKGVDLCGGTTLGELLGEILLLKNEFANCEKSAIA